MLCLVFRIFMVITGTPETLKNSNNKKYIYVKLQVIHTFFFNSKTVFPLLLSFFLQKKSFPHFAIEGKLSFA